MTVTLAHGAHDAPPPETPSGEVQIWAAELVSFVVREPFSDHPKCTSPVSAGLLESSLQFLTRLIEVGRDVA